MQAVSVNRLLLLALFLDVAIGACLPEAAACPFCLGSQQLTLRERIETPDASVLVEWQSGEPGNLARDVPASTTFDVLKVWRGEIDADQPLTIDRYQEGKPGDRFLLIGSKLDDVIRWDRSIPLSEAALEYVYGLPTSEASIGERLRYAFRHLESNDTTIANDAFDVVGAAKYEDIAAEREHLVVDDLRKWVHDPQTHVTRLGVYGMLLGLAGSPEDIPGLRRKIFHDSAQQEIRIGIDGVMGGYLLLTGVDGLQELDAAYLQAAEVTPDNLNAVMNAVSFIWEYADGLIDKDRLRQSMRLALNHEPTRELAITNLARWQDWSAVDRLVALYEDEATDMFVKRAVIRFLIVASQADADALGDAERASVKQASEFLKVIREADPALFQRAERGLIRPRI